MWGAKYGITKQLRCIKLQYEQAIGTFQTNVKNCQGDNGIMSSYYGMLNILAKF